MGAILGQNIRTCRKLAGMTQADLAHALGYNSFTTVQKWESGESNPPLEVLQKMADMFSLNVTMLLNNAPNSKSNLKVLSIVSNKPQLIELLELLEEFSPQELEELHRFAKFLKFQ